MTEIQYFGPASCDEFGNTNYPYILKGKISRDGWSVVVEEPAAFAEKWPTVSTSYVARSEDETPRQLTNEEVEAFVGEGRKSVRDELHKLGILGESSKSQGR